jgi:hypothetical protein
MSKVEELEKLKGKIKALEVEIQDYETQLEAIVVNDKDDAATKQEKEEEKTRLSNLIIVRCGNLDRLYDEKKLLLLLEGAMAANQFAGAHTGWRVCFVCPLFSVLFEMLLFERWSWPKQLLCELYHRVPG